MHRRSLLQAALAAATVPRIAQAQAWPQKSIRFIVPYIPGSAPDVLARTLAERLTAALGQSLVIENRPGAGSNIGNEMIAKTAADGYTIGLATSAMITNPWLYRKVGYDPVTDFTPINLSVAMPHLLVVTPDSPVKSVTDLVRLLKDAPGNITSVISKAALCGFPTLATAMPQVRGGRLRAIAVTGAKRNHGLPDVPSMGETIAGYDLASWFGLIAPAKTPLEVVRRIDAEVQKALQDPAFRDKVQADGSEVVNLGHMEFAAFMKSDFAKAKRVVELSGARVD